MGAQASPNIGLLIYQNAFPPHNKNTSKAPTNSSPSHNRIFSTFLANNPSILPPSIFLWKYFSKEKRNTKGLYEIGGKKLGYNFYTYTYGRFKI